MTLSSVNEYAVLTLCSSFIQGLTVGYENESQDKAAPLREIIAALDATGALDWRRPLKEGRNLFTTMLVHGLFVPGLLNEIILRHGDDLFLHPDSEGVPAYQAYWRALTTKPSSSHTLYGKTVAEEKDCLVLLRVLPDAHLSWCDAPGDSPGAGWLSQALSSGNDRIVQALGARGVSFSSTHKNEPVWQKFKSFSQWEEFLASGGNPDETGVSYTFPDEPVWAHILRRKPAIPAFSSSLALWAIDNNKPGAHEARYWQRLQECSLSSLSECLTSRPDWKTLRNPYGLPALWVAAHRSPTLLRLIASRKKDVHGVLTARDNAGYGLWYHLLPHADDRTFTKKMISEIASFAKPSTTLLDKENRGLYVQCLISPPKVPFEKKPWFPFHAKITSSIKKFLLSLDPYYLWNATEKDYRLMAQNMLNNPCLGHLNWLEWHIMDSYKDDYSYSRSHSVSNNSSFKMSLPSFSPELRMGLLSLAVLLQIKENIKGLYSSSRKSGVTRLIEELETLGVAWPSECSLESWRTYSQGLVEKKASNGQSVNPSQTAAAQAYRDQWMARFESMHMANRLDVAIEDPVSSRRVRL